MIQVYGCQNNYPVINFSNYYMRYRFETFPNEKMDELYPTKTIIKEFIKTLDEF